MKALIATLRTQGQRANDFHGTLPGEIVILMQPCGRDRRDPDGGCGCARSFAGVESARGITTALIIEAEEAALVKGVARFWSTHWGRTEEEALAAAKQSLGAVEDRIARFPVGAVVERRGDSVRQRKEAP